MEKDGRTLQLIEKLQSSANLEAVEFPDYWDALLTAFAVKKGNKLAYVDTYNPDEGYYYELELLTPDEITEYTVIKRDTCFSEVEMINVIRQFLEI